MRDGELTTTSPRSTTLHTVCLTRYSTSESLPHWPVHAARRVGSAAAVRTGKNIPTEPFYQNHLLSIEMCKEPVRIQSGKRFGAPWV